MRPARIPPIVLQALADAGATQVEPGNGLTGTTPLHAVEDLPELPAVALSDRGVAPLGGKAYCFGGGFYIDPVFPDYDVKAIVAREPTAAATALRSVEVPPPPRSIITRMIERQRPGRHGRRQRRFRFPRRRPSSPAPMSSASRACRGRPLVETIANGYGRAGRLAGVRVSMAAAALVDPPPVLALRDIRKNFGGVVAHRELHAGGPAGEIWRWSATTAPASRRW